MTDAQMRAALLRAVLDEPESDLPRLAYADWLEEHGDQGDLLRADWIRDGIAHSQGIVLPPGWADRYFDRTYPLWDRVTVFPDDPYRFLGMPDYRGPRCEWDWDWRRGWVEEVRVTEEVFLSEGMARVFATHPVTRVKLVDKDADRSFAPPSVGWHKDRAGSFQSSILFPIWQLLSSESVFLGVRFYSTVELADLDLSRACVLHGRQRANLLQT